jgi:hypothetical protein
MVQTGEPKTSCSETRHFKPDTGYFILIIGLMRLIIIEFVRSNNFPADQELTSST